MFKREMEVGRGQGRASHHMGRWKVEGERGTLMFASAKKQINIVLKTAYIFKLAFGGICGLD